LERKEGLHKVGIIVVDNEVGFKDGDAEKGLSVGNFVGDVDAKVVVGFNDGENVVDFTVGDLVGGADGIDKIGLVVGIDVIDGFNVVGLYVGIKDGENDDSSKVLDLIEGIAVDGLLVGAAVGLQVVGFTEDKAVGYFVRLVEGKVESRKVGKVEGTDEVGFAVGGGTLEGYFVAEVVVAVV